MVTEVINDKLAKGLDELDKPATNKKAASAKPAKAESAKPKKAAAEKAAESDIPTPPKGVPVWPWRQGTAMQYIFMAIYFAEGGMTPKKFDSLFAQADKKTGTKAGPLHTTNRDFMLKVMRSGVNSSSWHGGSVLTHTWKFSEEGGRYRIYDVKYVGKAKEPTPEKPGEKKAGIKKSDAVKAAKADKKVKVAGKDKAKKKKKKATA